MPGPQSAICAETAAHGLFLTLAVQDGAELEIPRHSMPYGSTSEHGLCFVAYCASPEPFRKMLERMVSARSDGHHDRLLDFTRAVTGAAFFAPSADFLAHLA